nr:uncharacterized protein LOC103224490 [Chlorocebus sabaeus]
MNSLSGGASIPNATSSPNTPSTTNYQFSPPSPQATAPRPLRAHCGCGRHVNCPSPARGKKARPARRAPALRSPPRGPETARRLGALGAASGGAGPGAGRRASKGPPTTATRASGAFPRPPRTWSPTRRSPNFLLSLHFPRQSSGPSSHSLRTRHSEQI